MDLIRGKLRTKQGKKEDPIESPALQRRSSSKRELYRDGRSSSESTLQKNFVVSQRVFDLTSVRLTRGSPEKISSEQPVKQVVPYLKVCKTEGCLLTNR